jgi:hypothetical protein
MLSVTYLYLDIKIKHRLNLDIKDPNYILLKEIFKLWIQEKPKKYYHYLASKN